MNKAIPPVKILGINGVSKEGLAVSLRELRVGDWLEIYVTGLRLTTPTVLLGHVPAIIGYAGPHPFDLMYQINAQIPDGVDIGGNIVCVVSDSIYSSNCQLVIVSEARRAV